MMLKILISNFGFKEVFSGKMDKLFLLIYQLNYYFEYFLKDTFLYKILAQNEINIHEFADKWFTTLFSYNIKNEKVLRIYDMFLAQGWEFIIKFSIKILRKFSYIFKSKDCLDQIGDYFENFF